MLIYNFRSVDIFAIVFLTLMLQHLRRGYIHYQNTTILVSPLPLGRSQVSDEILFLCSRSISSRIKVDCERNRTVFFDKKKLFPRVVNRFV